MDASSQIGLAADETSKNSSTLHLRLGTVGPDGRDRQAPANIAHFNSTILFIQKRHDDVIHHCAKVVGDDRNGSTATGKGRKRRDLGGDVVGQVQLKAVGKELIRVIPTSQLGSPSPFGCLAAVVKHHGGGLGVGEHLVLPLELLDQVLHSDTINPPEKHTRCNSSINRNKRLGGVWLAVFHDCESGECGAEVKSNNILRVGCRHTCPESFNR